MGQPLSVLAFKPVYKVYKCIYVKHSQIFQIMNFWCFFFKHNKLSKTYFTLSSVEYLALSFSIFLLINEQDINHLQAGKNAIYPDVNMGHPRQDMWSSEVQKAATVKGAACLL